MKNAFRMEEGGETRFQEAKFRDRGVPSSNQVRCGVCGLLIRTNLRRHIQNIHEKKSLHISTIISRHSVVESHV